jgi:hypothetical protein
VDHDPHLALLGRETNRHGRDNAGRNGLTRP